jgi:hypothetical protein
MLRTLGSIHSTAKQTKPIKLEKTVLSNRKHGKPACTVGHTSNLSTRDAEAGEPQIGDQLTNIVRPCLKKKKKQKKWEYYEVGGNGEQK